MQHTAHAMQDQPQSGQPMTTATHDAAIPELWELRIPLAQAIGVPGRSFSSTNILLARIGDREGRAGVGYSRFFDAADLPRASAAARGLLSGANGLADFLAIERQEESAPAEDRNASRAAANAISMAAWDLAARRRGVACADLWGRAPGRQRLECYASALYVQSSLAALEAEARAYRQRGYRYVKMRVARSVEETLARVAAVRKVYHEPGTIAIEAALSWDAPTTHAFAGAMSPRSLWIEDPLPYDGLSALDAAGHALAAGEVLHTTAELIALYRSGKVANIIIDVQAIGGPVRFLEAARLLHTLGATIGSHRFPQQSVQLLACLPASLPVEMIDWSNPALAQLPDPDGDGCVPAAGPGFNVGIDEAMLQQHGVRLV